MEKFVASNGISVHVHSDDELRIGPLRGKPQATQALREFFQAEADERLGRWRSKLHSDFVVRAGSLSGEIEVSDQAGRGSIDYLRKRVPDEAGDWWDEVAIEYFEAHPEPNPWHEAKAGEVWAVTWDGRESACTVLENEGFSHGIGFNPVNTVREEIGTRAPAIETAHRIWPIAEVTS